MKKRLDWLKKRMERGRGNNQKAGGGGAKNWKRWRKYFKGHLPLLSLREKLWL